MRQCRVAGVVFDNVSFGVRWYTLPHLPISKLHLTAGLVAADLSCIEDGGAHSSRWRCFVCFLALETRYKVGHSLLCNLRHFAKVALHITSDYRGPSLINLACFLCNFACPSQATRRSVLRSRIFSASRSCRPKRTCDYTVLYREQSPNHFLVRNVHTPQLPCLGVICSQRNILRLHRSDSM